MKFKVGQSVVIEDYCGRSPVRVRFPSRVIKVDPAKRRYLITPDCGDPNCGREGCLYSPGDSWYEESDVLPLTDEEVAMNIGDRLEALETLTEQWR